MIDCNKITSESLASERLLIIAPHMDDEILGCGGLILLHEDRSKIHCIYVTDGAKSPSPLLPWAGTIDPDLKEIRRNEALDVMNEAGIPPENLVFLNFPDGTLSHNDRKLNFKLAQEISRIDAAIVLAPFRYDLHSDHVAVNRSIRAILSAEASDRCMLEYLVYYRWRLIRSGDIRTVLPDSRLVEVDTADVAERKSSAIHQYRSQTEILNSWQEQPVLTPESIADRCNQAEYFLLSDPHQSPSAIFGRDRVRVLTAHFVQRFGKRPKDQLFAILKRFFQLG